MSAFNHEESKKNILEEVFMSVPNVNSPKVVDEHVEYA
jgi:hypothetical protein